MEARQRSKRSLRKIVLVMAIASAALHATAIASAGGNDYALSASPQSQFVSPGESATIKWSAWTNTQAPASCDVSVDELNLTAFSGIIQPGTTVGGQVSTPAIDRNSKFTFTLTCGGSPVARRAVNVKIR
jgi:hypothetical protein